MERKMAMALSAMVAMEKGMLKLIGPAPVVESMSHGNKKARAQAKAKARAKAEGELALIIQGQGFRIVNVGRNWVQRCRLGSMVCRNMGRPKSIPAEQRIVNGLDGCSATLLWLYPDA